MSSDGGGGRILLWPIIKFVKIKLPLAVLDVAALLPHGDIAFVGQFNAWELLLGCLLMV